MPSREERIREDLSPAALNRVLIENYHYDLYDFAHSLAIVLRTSPPYRLWNIWLARKMGIRDYSIIARERGRLTNIRRRLRTDLKSHLTQVSRVANPIFPDEITRGAAGFDQRDEASKSFIVDSVYGINDFLGNEIDCLNAILSVFRHTKGSPAASRNILAGLWSLVIKDTRRIHIEEIGNLLDWFYARLEGTSYQEEINPPPGQADISRFLNRGFRELLEADCREIFAFRYPARDPDSRYYPFLIHFRHDEPAFQARRGETAPLSRILVFPHNVVLTNPALRRR